VETLVKQIVATVPLSPRCNPSLGYGLCPFAANVIGQFKGLSSLVAINTVGSKRSIESDEQMFTRLLSGFIEAPFETWHDEKQS